MENPKEPSLGYWAAVVGQQYFQAMRKLLAHLPMDRWYFALVQLAETEGPVTQQALADKLHLDKATMVRALDHLCAHGYVERRQCPNDRRKHHLVLMPKARPVVKEIKQAYAQLNDLAFGRTSEAQRQKFTGQLQEMTERLKQAGTNLPGQPTKNR